MSRVLIVEDELIPANYLKKVLLSEGYDVLGIAVKGADAIRMALEKKPDIILMDIMLSDGVSGSDAALAINAKLPECKIIFLTAYAEEQMLDMAAQAKAYAYLVKPYREKEIIATLKLAVLQKSALPTLTHTELAFEYRFEHESARLFKNHSEVALGPVALRLIALLCRTPQSSVSMPSIMQHVWGNEVSPQTLRSLIHRIRELTHKELILNVNKSGYKINAKS